MASLGGAYTDRSRKRIAKYASSTRGGGRGKTLLHGEFPAVRRCFFPPDMLAPHRTPATNTKIAYPYMFYVYLCALEVWRMMHGQPSTKKNVSHIPLTLLGPSLLIGDDTCLRFVQGRNIGNMRNPFSSNWLTCLDHIKYSFVVWWLVTLTGRERSSERQAIRCVGIPDMMQRFSRLTKATTTFSGAMHVNGDNTARFEQCRLLFEAMLAHLFPEPPPDSESCSVQFDSPWMYWVWNSVEKSRQRLVLKEKNVVFCASDDDRMQQSRKQEQTLLENDNNPAYRYFHFDELPNECEYIQLVTITERDTISHALRRQLAVKWKNYCELRHNIAGGAFFGTLPLPVGAPYQKNMYRMRMWHEFPDSHCDQLRLLREDQTNAYLERPASSISPYQCRDYPDVFSEPSLSPGVQEPTLGGTVQALVSSRGARFKLVGRRLPQCPTLEGYLKRADRKPMSVTKKKKKSKKRHRAEEAGISDALGKRSKQSRWTDDESPPTTSAPGGLPCRNGNFWRDSHGQVCCSV